ncbi:hypothetical protein BH683_000120 [Williamsia sp. 1138]|uniref:linalool dehydratase/isomerase domain-containing protein n=1 Tax=Williamsia sp. 1138 TaxID=1903117 RepID=UPI000A11BCBD|nr:hypothetical protein [Williamsia sp. 1138]OZG31202.1 hypothetical protein BH683_000120 [Williamsia sp. 1138]
MTAHAHDPSMSTHHVGESTTEDLQALRYLLDLALQPLDRFDGFTHAEQMFLSALRYQLNGLCWALSLSQRTRTPAFTGYLAEAQRNAILKMCDRKVWGYWSMENLVGYGRWNPDPIAHHNIMYSAYLGVMIGWYETLNEDNTFSSPASLSLHWKDRRSYEYDFTSLAEAIRRNMLERPDSPQYPCEPHLVYPVCNTYALNTLQMHDRLHGTELTGDLIERVRHSYTAQTWRRPDGRFYSGKTRNGRLPFLPPTLTNDAWMAYWLSSPMPDIARDTWTMLRENYVHLDDGELTLLGAPEQRVDPGNYSLARGGGPTYTILLKAAVEHGDDEAARALSRLIDKRYPLTTSAGAARHTGLSTLGNVLAAMGRFGGPSITADLNNGNLPDQWSTGPILAEAAYPEVLVARAVTDGRRLDLVLRPGTTGRSLTELGIHRLVPHMTYAVTGASESHITANAQGAAHIWIHLSNRTELHIVPAGD